MFSKIILFRNHFYATAGIQTKLKHYDICLSPVITWCQDAVALVEPDNLSHFSETFMFHEDEGGRDLVGEHVGVGSRR